MTDMVNHPPHYKDASGVECIDITKHMGFCDGNCIKYLYRAGKKGDVLEDLKKALWYADEYLEKENQFITWYRIFRVRKPLAKLVKSRFTTKGQIWVGCILDEILQCNWAKAAREIDFLIHDIETEIKFFGYSKTANALMNVERD